MNTRWNVIIAALDSHAALAEELCRRLTRAWSCSTPCTFASVPATEIPIEGGIPMDAFVLIANASTPQSTTLGLLNSVEETGVPVLAVLDARPESGNCYEFAGAMVECWSAPDAVLAGLLLGALNRQQEVKRWRSEAALSQRFHGGLKGQISKMHEELQLAAVVQREFLPRELPSMHGVEFAALWRPTNYVSGDIYDIMRLDEDHVGVFVADAVGHGVPAALMTMVICRSLVTKEISGSTYRIVTPSEVLSRLNAEMIRRQGRTTRFTTAVYAVVDCRRRVMTLAGAGHPPPVRLSPSGDSQVLETAGGLLGVFADETYSQIEVELSVDDRVLFYTDGFEQAFPAAQSDAHQRRVPTNTYRSEFDLLGQLASATEMIDAISQRLDDQSGSLHQIDDLTLVCMHAGPFIAGSIGRDGEPDQAPATPVADGPTLRLAS